MEVELRFFATFREVVGQKELQWTTEGDTVGDVLRDLTAAYPELEIFEDDGSIRQFLTIMRNGRDITFLDGLDTELSEGDAVAIFPPVAGGAQRITRSFRGISPRAAIHYLTRIGGSQIDEATVEGEHWRASLSTDRVEVGPTLQLTEVTVTFEGEPEDLEPVVDEFAQKAMRAGG